MRLKTGCDDYFLSALNRIDDKRNCNGAYYRKWGQITLFTPLNTRSLFTVLEDTGQQLFFETLIMPLIYLKESCRSLILALTYVGVATFMGIESLLIDDEEEDCGIGCFQPALCSALQFYRALDCFLSAAIYAVYSVIELLCRTVATLGAAFFCIGRFAVDIFRNDPACCVTDYGSDEEVIRL